MKRIVLLLTLILLSGCVAVPVKQKFPDAPKELMQVCPDLKQTEPTEKLSDVLKVITKNYSQYHECQLSVDTWIEWYSLQRELFNK